MSEDNKVTVTGANNTVTLRCNEAAYAYRYRDVRGFSVTVDNTARPACYEFRLFTFNGVGNVTKTFVFTRSEHAFDLLNEFSDVYNSWPGK